jgi:hypothetical protein
LWRLFELVRPDLARPGAGVQEGAGRGRTSHLVAQPPEGIALERSRDLDGRTVGPCVRRLLLCAVAALPVLALLGV